MDSLRGNFESAGSIDAEDEFDTGEDENVNHDPPPEIGQDERRMQVRAYNHWASLLGNRSFPSIEDLEPANLPDFGPYSVLLDFTSGIDDPAVPYLGGELAQECGAGGEIGNLSEVPSRSLLSRITDHYMQILANQAPIGFEAEFVNQRGATILYRGILLPFSSNDDSIDFIYGVINWKELADQRTTDELLLEIDQALEADQDTPTPRSDEAMGDWADGPGSELIDAANDAGEVAADAEAAATEMDDHSTVTNFPPGPLDDYDDEDFDDGEDDGHIPGPSFGSLTERSIRPQKSALDLSALSEAINNAGENDGQDAGAYSDGFETEDVATPQIWDEPDGPLTDHAGHHVADPAFAHNPPDYSDDAGDEVTGLYDCLAAARESAQAARSCEDRSRTALYDAVGRAYDVSLAAADEPEEFDQLMADNGLTVQERAPMTPVVKLVFGAEYDKTRLTEYAAVLGHAHRMQVERGRLAGFLREAEGGLKGVVTAERRLRREESGKAVDPVDAPREALARKLRKIQPQPLDAISSDGAEFGLVMIRRMPDGTVAMLGEIAEDIPLVERAARKLIS